MKTSWVIGVVMMWIVIMGLEMMATGGTFFSTSSHTSLETLAGPILTNLSSSTPAIVSIVTNVGNIFITIIEVAFLYSPTIWTGYWLWVWMVCCLPVGIGMVYGAVSLARGVSTG